MKKGLKEKIIEILKDDNNASYERVADQILELFKEEKNKRKEKI